MFSKIKSFEDPWFIAIFHVHFNVPELFRLLFMKSNLLTWQPNKMSSSITDTCNYDNYLSIEDNTFSGQVDLQSDVPQDWKWSLTTPRSVFSAMGILVIKFIIFLILQHILFFCNILVTQLLRWINVEWEKRIRMRQPRS